MTDPLTPLVVSEEAESGKLPLLLRIAKIECQFQLGCENATLAPVATSSAYCDTDQSRRSAPTSEPKTARRLATPVVVELSRACQMEDSTSELLCTFRSAA